MTRCWNVEQKTLYKNYIKIGKKIAVYSLSQQEDTLSNQYAWELITREGIWKLPLHNQSNSACLIWDECIIALEGLISTYQNKKFFTSIVEQFSILYLTFQYGTKSQKKSYLPRIIQGEAVDDKTLLIPRKKNAKILCDLTNFKRLLYGVIAARFASPLIEKHREIYQQEKTFKDDSVNELCEKATHKILESRKTICSLLISFGTTKAY